MATGHDCAKLTAARGKTEKVLRWILGLFLALAPTGLARAHEVMTVGNRTGNTFTVIDIRCNDNHCVLAGTRISKRMSRPIGANGDPRLTCFVETTSSEFDVKEVEGVLTREDVGGSCRTHLVSLIDFKRKSYVSRSYADRPGPACADQRDRRIEYGIGDQVAVAKGMKCDAIESIVSLWQP
jgi:hypothetical protein